MTYSTVIGLLFVRLGDLFDGGWLVLLDFLDSLNLNTSDLIAEYKM